MKVKFALEQAMKSLRYIYTLSLTTALDGGDVTPRPLYSRERDPVPFV
jgi:hypothetical protein